MIARFLSDFARLDAVYDAPRTEASEEPPPPLLGSVERRPPEWISVTSMSPTSTPATTSPITDSHTTCTTDPP